MDLKTKVFHAMQNDSTLSTDEAFAMATAPSVERAKQDQRDLADRRQTGNARSEGVVRCMQRFPHLDAAGATAVALAVQANGDNGGALDRALAPLLSAGMGADEAIRTAKDTVARGGKAAPLSANDIAIKLTQADPSLDAGAAVSLALKLRDVPGGVEHALLRLKQGDSVTIACSAALAGH